MTENHSATGAASGDPVQALLLGFATQIDQLAGLVAGGSLGTSGVTAAIPGLLTEVGTLITELGDLLARIIAAFIAVLEAVAEMLRSTPAETAPPSTRFEPIAVTITPMNR